MKVLTSVFAVALALLATGKLLAADPPTPDSSAPKRGPRLGPGGGGLDFLKGLDLTDDQKAKLGDLMKEFRPKFKETSAKMAGIYTDEQKAAIKEAVQKARADGKNFQEIRKAVEDAVKPTPEQETKLKEARKEIESVQKELREKVMAILTPEQKEKVEKKIKEHEAAGDTKKPSDSSK
jgi:Spy/CpxP family protein refolding chaperone